MSLWIPVTLAAAFFQTLRFILQKQLSTKTLSAAGATFARFVYAAPFAVLIAAIYLRLSTLEMPALGLAFWGHAVTGGVAQILATICVVLIFKSRNFAVGITLKKTEVIQAVMFGLLILGEGVSALGLAAIAIGLVGVVILSETGTGWRAGLSSRALWLGLASGALFAVSGVSYRGASLAVAFDDPMARALVTLAAVTSLQTLLMAVWLRAREQGQITAVARAWPRASMIGLFSLLGSGCWFLAFTLQTVAYVKALGQVELILSILASTLIFHERISARELTGIAIIGASVVLLIAAV